jgi:UDP-glucuronate decarboxylase
MESSGDFTGPVNLGNPEESTIGELAETIVRLTASRSRIVHAARPVDDPQKRRPDIGLARERLGFAPTVGLEEGLAKTIAYFDALLRAGHPAAAS